MNQHEHIARDLALLVALGAAGQWIGARTRLPSVLWLLTIALVLGPVTGWMNPDKLLGELLLPLVSLSVAIILFEGSLELKFADLRRIGRPLAMLLTVGALITWVLSASFAYGLLGTGLAASVLLGSILVVTGPTVIGPIIATVRPSPRVTQLLRWEGITIDPLGAMLALLVFESIGPIDAGNIQQAIGTGAVRLVLTVLSGSLVGWAGAWLLRTALARFWVPDHLHGISSLATLLLVFVTANAWQPESGLLAVTLLGILLTNDSNISLERVGRFHQSLSTLLLSSLFLLLGSRLQLSDIVGVGVGGLVFVAALILVVRPVSVFISTIGTALDWPERLFAAALAPRGIVAAAVSSLFVLRLGEEFQPLIPATFAVIVFTVLVYGLSSGPMARWLGLSVLNPQGCLLLGADVVGRSIGKAIKEAGLPVLLIDTNRENLRAARTDGLRATMLNVLSEDVIEEELDLNGIGRFLALTSNDEINILSCHHFKETFGSEKVYQLPPASMGGKKTAVSPRRVGGRILFAPEASHHFLEEKLEHGFSVRTTKLTEKFKPGDFLTKDHELLILFVITPDRQLRILAPGGETTLAPGCSVVSLSRRISSADAAGASSGSSADSGVIVPADASAGTESDG